MFVKRHEHSILFDQAFKIFWRRRALIEKLIAQMSPMAPPGAKKEEKPKAGALRVAGCPGSAAEGTRASEGRDANSPPA